MHLQYEMIPYSGFREEVQINTNAGRNPLP